MAGRRYRWFVIVGLAVGIAAYLSLNPLQSEGSGSGASPVFPCLTHPTLNNVVPPDSAVTDQPALNCFAWQEFIALNWPAADGGAGAPSTVGPSGVGIPGDLSPVVWETYMDVHQVFTPNGSQPPPWGTPPPTPPSCIPHSQGSNRTLVRSTKFTVEFDAPEDLSEAFPTDGSPNWLADRNGNPVLYEIMMNEDEYDYIFSNGYYSGEIQYDRVSNSNDHVDLPRGSLETGVTGSIEIKAAWLVVPDPTMGDWRQKYKLAEALVFDESDSTCSLETVALVGLHILHKTKSQPQWIWATFEHVDNAPDQSAVDAGTAGNNYTFYDPSCQEVAVSANCEPYCGPPPTPRPTPTLPATTSCAPNTPPAYCLDLHDPHPDCPPYPIQVTRLYPIPDALDNPVQQINAAAQELIRQGRADSVWQYYQLVGVLWSDSPVDENHPGSMPPQKPLSVSGMRPSPVALPLANTVLETYAQHTTCVSCHRYSEIAWGPLPGNTPFSSDYSFMFKNACAPEDCPPAAQGPRPPARRPDVESQVKPRQPHRPGVR